MATPSFQSVMFIDPWGTVPSGLQAGVQVTISNSASAPSGSVVIARLLQSGAAVAYGTGGTAGYVVVVPPGPLTAAIPYQVQAQWVPQGTNPATASWTGTGVVTAPVITSGVGIVSGSVAASTVSFAWAPEGSAQPAYGFVQTFDAAGKAASILVAQGGSGSASFKYTPGNAYVAYASAAALISPSVPNVYTSGPLSPARAVPATAPTLSSVAYDGTTLTVGWTAPALPASPVVVDPTYAILLYSGTTVVGTFAAGPGGGTAVVDVDSLGPSIVVAGRVSYGAIRGPDGLIKGPVGGTGQVTVISGAPAISSLVGTASTVTATLAPPASTAGISGYQGFLFEDGRQVAGPVAATDSGGTNTVAFSYAMNPQRRYTMCARGIGATAGVTGPMGTPAVAVSSVPTVISTVYDGTAVTAAWGELPEPVTGYRATLADAGGTVIGAPVTVQGTTAVIPAAGLAPGTAYNVTVQAVAGQALGPASTAMPVVVETVALSAAAYDGALLSLSWAAATTAGASYEVEVSANGAVVASQASGQTSAAIPIVLSSATSYSAAVRVIAGTARGKAGAATGIVSAVPGVVAVVATTSAMTATVAVPNPAPNVTGYQGWLYEGDSIVAGPIAATTSGGVTSVAFPYAVAADKRYAIRVGATGAGSVTGPQGAAAAVVSAAPAVEATSYNGNAVTASWSPALDPSVTAYVATLAEVGGAVVGSPVTVEGTTVSIPAAGLDPAKSYQVTVLATSGAATGPAGAAGPVVVETVAVTASSYDGAILSLSWAASGTDGATYVAQVLSGGTVVAEQAVAQNSAAIAVALAAGGSYTASVQVLAGSARGPSGTAAGVVAAIPGVSSVEATASTVTAVVTVPSSAANVTGYRGWLYEGDAIVTGPVAATTSGGVTSVVFTYGVQPQSRYTVVVQATGAAGFGPTGAPGAVVSSVPSVTSTLYDGTDVTATWDAVGDGLVTGYVATLTDADGGVIGSPVTVEGTTAVIPAPDLEPDATYNVTVQAIGNAATGPASAAAAVLAEALSITGATYDGALLSLAWAPATTPGATYRVQVAANGTAVATQASSQTSAVIPVLLSASGSYTAAVQVVVGGSTGPLGTATGLVTAVPGSGETTATATGVTAVVEPPAVTTNVQGYQGWLYEGGQQVAGPVAATTAGGVTTVAFTYALHPSNPYAARLQAVGASAALAGPVAPPAGVMASIPVVTSTAFDGTRTRVTWDAVADASITGYRATLWDSDGNAIGTPVDVQTTEAVLPGPVPESGKTYSVSVQALGALSVGAASATMPVVVETVALSAVAYDGALLSLSWAAATTAGGAYEVEVSANGAVVASQASGQTSAAIPIALSGATSYSAAVRVIAGTARGNAGAATGIVSAVPGVDAVVATASAVTATVVVPSPALNVTGYQGWLYEGDSIVAGPVAATTSEGVTSVAFSYAVAADKRYAIRVGATGAGSATGPQGAAAAVVSAAPAVEATSYDGSTATASWSPVLDPSVTAYVATLAEVGGAAVGSPVTVEGTSVSIPAAGLVSAKSYQVTVQALSGSATGPAGAAGNVIVETVAVSAAAYDGALFALSWGAATTAGASYVAQVLSGGMVIAEQASAQNSAAIPVALAAGGNYTASVQVVAGSARGPSGAAAGVITAIPGVSSVEATASTVTAVVVVPGSAPNVNGYNGWLYEGDAIVAGPVAATTSEGITSVAFSYGVQPQSRYTVVMQAVGASAAIAGPVSTPAPVISSTPQIVATGYDGSTVTVAWEASADPTVSGYLATLGTAAGAIVGSPVATAGTRASIPAASLSLDTDYVVTVQATADAATGPASAPANPLAESVGFFFPDQSSTQYPYLFRGDLRAPGASNISLYLPALFSGELAAPIVQDPFTLSATAAGSTFPLVLTVPQDATIDVWNVDQNGIRPALQSAYVAFLTKVEADAAGLLPGALDVLRQAIAQGLPLNFAETLYYTYGLDPSAGVVDLMAGTRLRIDYEEYQSVPPGTGTPQPLLSGYTGAGTSVYDVGSLPPSSGAVPLGMNAFFSALPVPTVAGNSGGGGGILDLIASNFHMPYLRLLFPPTMVSADSGGAVGVASNIVFLSAMSWTQLQAATQMYAATQGFSGVTGIDYTYFRGRAALFPEVPVRVDGSAVYVPVGTTVRQVIERVAVLPYGVSQALTGFAMRRPIGAVVNQQDAYAEGYALGRSNQVHFGPQGLAAYRYTSGLDAFDLPVLGGDVFFLGDEPAGDG